MATIATTEAEMPSALGQATTVFGFCPHSRALTALPPASVYDPPFVTVKIGPSAKEFKVLRGVLCYYSPIFKAALEGNFSEASQGVLELADEDPEAFQASVSWMYTRRLFEPTQTQRRRVPLTFATLLRTYTLGEARLMPGLKNAVIDALIEKIADEWTIFTTHVKIVYDRTPEGSPLRKLATEMVIRTCELDHIRASLVDQPREYLWDLLLAYAKRDNSRTTGKQIWQNIDRCQFHEHTAPTVPPKTLAKM